MSIITKTVPALAIAAAMIAGSGAAKADIRTGQLICKISGGTGLIIVSQKELACHFDRVDGAREFYTGTVDKFGVDLGVTIGGTLIWSVFQPAVVPGGLSGTYVGGAAEATAGVGIGASALIGGGPGGVTLQPVSIQAQAGANVAAGVGAVTLVQAPPQEYVEEPIRRPRRHYRHHHYHHHG